MSNRNAMLFAKIKRAKQSETETNRQVKLAVDYKKAGKKAYADTVNSIVKQAEILAKIKIERGTTHKQIKQSAQSVTISKKEKTGSYEAIMVDAYKTAIKEVAVVAKRPFVFPAKKKTIEKSPKAATLFKSASGKVATPAKKKKNARSVLFGSGMTQKVIDKAAKQDKADKVKRKHVFKFLNKTQDQPKTAQEEKYSPTDPLEAAEKIIAKADVVDEDRVPLVSLHTEMSEAAQERAARELLLDNIELDPSQIIAIKGILANQFSILIGPAGSGKTTISRIILMHLVKGAKVIDLRSTNRKQLEVIDDLKKKGEYESGDLDEKFKRPAISGSAFTGRAVDQQRKAWPENLRNLCQTIHTTLGYYPEYYEIQNDEGKWKTTMEFVPYFTPIHKMPYDVYIIDEVGMLSTYLGMTFLGAMKSTAKIIFTGDINQLVPVQGRSILGFAMTQWPVFELTKIWRSDAPIIASAHNILAGKMPQRVKGIVDMIEVSDSGKNAKETLLRVIKLLASNNEFDPKHDVIIVPQNVGAIGQIALNELLVPFFNPPREEHGVVINPRTMIKTGIETRVFAEGDKVMVLENNREMNITNGMCGFITKLVENTGYRTKEAQAVEMSMENFMANMSDAMDEAAKKSAKIPEEEEREKATQRQSSHVATVEFENGAVVEFNTAGGWANLTMAYAMTCHKMQGGEAPTVIILCHSANDRMLYREWLYTAATRAAKRVVFVYNKRGINTALKRMYIKGNTLAEKIESFNKLGDQGVEIPQLPKPNLLQSIESVVI